MSVREDLAKILAGGRITPNSIMWGVADELLKAHAHELAEEIRAGIDESWYGAAFCDGMNQAADLIDPEEK